MRTLRDLFEQLADLSEDELDKDLHLTVWDQSDNWNCKDIDINTDGTCSDLQLVLDSGYTVSYNRDKVFEVPKH